MVHCSEKETVVHYFEIRNFGALFRNSLSMLLYILQYTYCIIQNSSLGLGENSFIWGRGKKEHLFPWGNERPVEMHPSGGKLCCKAFFSDHPHKKRKVKDKGTEKREN